MRKTLTTLAAAAAFTLAACTGGAQSDKEVGASKLPGDSSMHEEIQEPAEEPEPTSMVLNFGEVFTWEDNVSAKVEEVGDFTPGDVDVFEPGYTAHRVFRLTVVNDGEVPLDLGGGTVQAASGGAAADEVYGEYKGAEVGGFPYNNLLPGKSQSFYIVLGVMDPKDIQVEVSPGWEHDYAIFTSK